MKKLYYFIVLFPIISIGQTDTENFIKTTTYKTPTQNSITNPIDTVATINVTYYDGMGRPIQKIAANQSNNGNDIITHIEYDEFGRQPKKYLPYVSRDGNNIRYDSNAKINTLNYTDINSGGLLPTSYLDQNPFSEKKYDTSPLNRIVQQGAPGANWAIGSGHEIKFDYSLNSANEVINFSVSSSGGLVHYGYYKPNLVHKIITKNENWSPTDVNDNTTQEFKDNYGRIILKRTFDKNIPHDTYYVYDKIGNLTYVLPPKFFDAFSVSTNNSTSNTCNTTAFIDFKNFMVPLGGPTDPIAGGGGAYINISNGIISINFNGGFEFCKLNEDASPIIIDPAQCVLPDMAIGYFQMGPSYSFDYFVYIENNRLHIVKRISWQETQQVSGFNATISATIDQQYSEIAVNPIILDGLCYSYRYDNYNRLIEKKIPGKQWEFIVYDNLDRVVATGPAFNPFGDGTSGWMITKYDVFGRVAYTAWLKQDHFGSNERNNYQKDFNTNSNLLYETKSGSSIDNIDNIYSSNVYPKDSYKLLNINYYDDYNFQTVPSPLPIKVLGQDLISNTKGMSTGFWVRVLTVPNEKLANINYVLYDKKGRPIKSYTTNYLGGSTSVENKYNFAGQVLKTITNHHKSEGIEEVRITEDFQYTPQGRLLNHFHQVNNRPKELMCHNQYDELGKLISKRVGGSDITNFSGLQKVDYGYNIRGWLKKINNVNNLNDSDDPTDLFAFNINYDDNITETVNGAVNSLYNGNISETYWRTASDNTIRKYGYQYDNLNRLLGSYYQKPQAPVHVTNSYNEIIDYDKNGNITGLFRTGGLDDQTQTLPIDQLAYSYKDNSNQLIKVTDLTNEPQGFKDDSLTDPNDVTDDYTYDANGNMTKDDNKGIANIQYNHLNLPTQITFDATKIISYLYDATGKKIRKNVIDGENEVTTHYLDGFQYKGDDLQFFPTAEGYVNISHIKYENGVFQEESEETINNQYSYVYNYVDHLGNIRLSYGKDPSNGALRIIEENHYYPFGLKHTNYNSDKMIYVKEDEALKIKLSPNTIKTLYNYKYNGKELQDELGLNMYDYGARNYDPALGRWMNIDPLAETSRRWSPNNYTYNNPIFFVDPDGMKVINGDQSSRDEALRTKNEATEAFNKNYSSCKLTKNNFSSKSEWKQYKERRNIVEIANKNYDQAEANYQHTQKSIDNFKEVDPENFAKADNLTYTNKNGEVKNLDILVTTKPCYEFGGGHTDFGYSSTTGNVRDGMARTSIDPSLSVTSFGLAHEFGHSFGFSKSPAEYIEGSKVTHNCQDPDNRYTIQSKSAMDWQEHYNDELLNYIGNH